MSEGPQPQVRTTIGLTDGGKAALAKIMAAEWFSEDRHAFKFAVAHALSKDLPPTSDAEGPFGTIWNRGTLDPDDRLVQLVSIYTSEPDVWDFIRRTGDAGLRDLAEGNAQVGLPTDVIGTASE